MKLKHKVILIFSIIYWILIAGSLLLFGFAFQTVPLGHVSLLGSQFTGKIQPNYYISGFYNKGIGYYFLDFPITKVIKQNIPVSTMNQNMYKITAKYTLVYRINPNQVFSLYQKMGMSYQNRLISSVNSIVSSVFMNQNQANTRVTLEGQIISQLRVAASSNSSKLSVFSNLIMIEGFWLTEIDYPQELQVYYSKEAFQDSSSYSTTYVSTEIQLQKTLTQIQTIKAVINNTQRSFMQSMSKIYNQNFDKNKHVEELNSQQNLVNLNRLYNTSRIFKYYQPSRINFV